MDHGKYGFFKIFILLAFSTKIMIHQKIGCQHDNILLFAITHNNFASDTGLSYFNSDPCLNGKQHILL